MQTLSELLRSQARHFRDKTYLVCEDKSWTYGEYFSQVEKLAQVLVEHGVRKGQPVCLYLPSRPELAFAYHAVFVYANNYLIDLKAAGGGSDRASLALNY